MHCMEAHRQLDLPFEEWRPVAGYEGKYDVSAEGRVWSSITNRVLRPAPTSRGYLSVVLYDGSRPKKGKAHCVHDLVAAAFIGTKPKGLEIDHRDANKRNNAYWNLEYVTSKENTRRAEQNGLIPHYRGWNNPNAKLNAEQVAEIRSLASTTTYAALARQYGVDAATIRSVVLRLRYKDIA